MGKTIIHIGYHKTGTTWFQHILYPKMTNYKFCRSDIIRKYFIDIRPFDFDPNIAKEAFKSDEDLLLSDEELSGNMHNGGLNGYLSFEIANRLKKVFPQAIIVIFIRNQWDIIASCYRQYIKEGGTYNITKYCNSKQYPIHREATFSFEHFKYDMLINHYQSLFDNVLVYRYEDFREHSEKFVESYIDELGIEIDGTINYSQQKNVGYSNKLLRLARVLNEFTRKKTNNKHYLIHIPKYYEFSRTKINQIAPLFKGSKSSKELLGSDLFSYINGYYKASNRNLSSNLCIDGYPQ